MTAELGLADFLGLGLAPRTAYQYARIVDRVCRQLDEAGTSLETCTAPEVAAMTMKWRGSYSSRARLRAALVSAWALIDRANPPARAIRVPPKPRGRCRALSTPDARRLEERAWARGDDAGLAVLIGLYAGLRRAEIASLRWDNVLCDPEGHPEWVRVVGKGDVQADVPVHPVLAAALAPRRRRTGWVFEGRFGGSVNPATIWTYVRSVAAEVGLPELKPHVLRHTALAECNDRSGDLRTVQEIARHSRPEITSLYTRVTAQRLREVIAMIDYGRQLGDDGDEAA